mgnify:FL=1
MGDDEQKYSLKTCFSILISIIRLQKYPQWGIYTSHVHGCTCVRRIEVQAYKSYIKWTWVVEDLDCIPLKYKSLFTALRSTHYLHSSFGTTMLYNCQNKYLIARFISRQPSSHMDTNSAKRRSDAGSGPVRRMPSVHNRTLDVGLPLVRCRWTPVAFYAPHIDTKIITFALPYR